MQSFLEKITDEINLSWAWGKVKNSSTPGDIWIDERALASFEVNLAEELASIAQDLRDGTYHITALRPMAFPKNPDGDGNPRVRQYFHVSVRDQVTWVAVVNIVGPHLDRRMPAWSYGNRLYRSVWIEKDEYKNIDRKFGPYRHSAGKIYRPFRQSWPLFRRHVALSIAAANAGTGGELLVDAEESAELEIQERLAARFQCRFVRREYWDQASSKESKAALHWASVDLERFYPSIAINSCCDAIVKRLPLEDQEQAKKTLSQISVLPLDLAGWSRQDLESIDLNTSRKTFHKIPTGLFVSGFLANAVLLDVDEEVDRSLPEGRVAHFRYVDDHVVLARSFDELTDWLATYRKILEVYGSGARVNAEKTEPKELGAYLARIEKGGEEKTTEPLSALKREAMRASKLDFEFPAPLMTRTLALVSAIGKTNFFTLEDNELGTVTQQLEHLLLVEIPETELPARTRLAFAATRLAQVVEARLASPDLVTHEDVSRDSQSSNPAHPDVLKKSDRSARSIQGQLNGLANRALRLVLKVLRERPDRVRLWTHALVISRRLGAEGISDLFRQIDDIRARDIEKLGGSYILANSYAVLGSQCMNAAWDLLNGDCADWRKEAAERFLLDVANFLTSRQRDSEEPWFVQRSWDQLCVGIYATICALASAKHPNQEKIRGLFPATIFQAGLTAIAAGDMPQNQVAWAWWAIRLEMRNPIKEATPLILHIGKLVADVKESDAFWRFFPKNAPSRVLNRLSINKKDARGWNDGWWIDALSTRSAVPHVARNTAIKRALSAIQTNGSHLPLPKWIEHLRARKLSPGEQDPRLSEWTYLEIVRQVALILSSKDNLVFDANYIKRQKKFTFNALSAIHPYSVLMPIEFLEVDNYSWEDWQSDIQPGKPISTIKLSPENERIRDHRYIPIQVSPVGESVNSARGLGLILFGLLSSSFSLPVQWNGYGHDALLRLLPQILRSSLNYSSGTFGILEACLQGRALENILFKRNAQSGLEFSDDTTGDPIEIGSALMMARAIAIVQKDLLRNQISTLGNRPRQLTPINLMLLTGASWREYFGEGEADE